MDERDAGGERDATRVRGAAPDGGDVGAEGSGIVTLAWRGRDLAFVPPAALARLDDAALAGTLFGLEGAARLAGRFARDRRGHFLRFRPIDLPEMRAALDPRWRLEVTFNDHPALPFEPRLSLAPRPYQEEALAAWVVARRRGVVTLPTGAGKTFLGALAAHEARVWTLVVTPTIDLLGQWRRSLIEALGAPAEMVGVYGGGARQIAPVTVTTYESAQLHPELLRDFGLLIFDECHHLPAPTYRQIAEGAFAPFRLGLSATPERADLEHHALERLIGPEVYRRRPEDLAAARYLAEYDVRRLTVTLDAQERERYERARATYRDFLARRRIAITTPQDFQRKVLWASARDPEAREAMLAWREARSLALDAPAKLRLLEEIFARHRDERVLVFSEYNAVVAEISEQFAVPRITHQTAADERRAILEGFRSGRFTKLATGRVLNEGVDIPDCGVAVIVSGNATPREYIQRLGRVLRPKQRRATLYELVTEDTTEERVADRRREAPGQ